MVRLIVFLLLMSAFLPGKAQTGYKSPETLVVLASKFLDTKLSDSVKLDANAQFINYMQQALADSSSFEQPFSDLANISILTDAQKSFRIFTWLVVTSTGYQPMGLVQVKEGKRGKSDVTRLENLQEETKSLNYRTLSADKWVGVVYYDMIEVNYKKEKYYVLLGFTGNNGITHKKVIDVLSFSGRTPKFGKPVFLDENERMQSRVVFEYAAMAKMSLKQDAKGKTIAFDHLAPSDLALKDQYQFYGPDFTYDSYSLSKGKWYLKTNIDLRNEGENLGKPGIPMMVAE